MDPRISFSNDFVETQRAIRVENMMYREAPVSSDFEFSVKNNCMKPADEIMFQGMLLPVKDRNCTDMSRKTTLRDELLSESEDEYGDMFFPRLPSTNSGWMEKLGIRRAAKLVSKKVINKNVDSSGGVAERADHDQDPHNRAMFVHEDVFSNCKDKTGGSKLQSEWSSMKISKSTKKSYKQSMKSGFGE